jgi:hypothetical protein
MLDEGDTVGHLAVVLGRWPPGADAGLEVGGPELNLGRQERLALASEVVRLREDEDQLGR